MGTRADFYVGRGKEAEWIGSIAFDGYPDGIDKQITNCAGDDAFRHAVAAELDGRDDATLPAHGWPWPWDDSCTTDFAYAFDDGRTWASCFGSDWWPANEERTEEEAEAAGKGAEFPDMKDKQNVTLGKRSGLIVVTAG